MNTKFEVINTVIMNIPMCGAICIAAQLLGTGHIVPSLTLINFALASVVSFLVGMYLPLVPAGLAFANFFKAEPDSLPFGLLVNVVVNGGYVVINSIVLTIFNVGILGGAPLIACFFAMMGTFVPLYAVGYVVSFLWNKPAESITKSICGE